MLSLSLLGNINITIDDKPPDRVVTNKAVALLVYLLLTKQVYSRHALAGLLWSEIPEAKAKASLRVALAGLRKHLPAYIKADRLSLWFEADQPFWCDVQMWDELVAEGKRTEAVKLMRGDFLADFHLENAPLFDEWVQNQRALWQQRALTLFSEQANHHLQQREYEGAIQLFQRLLEIEPWQEAAHRQLMLAYSRLRNFSAALRQYKTCQHLLDVELGVRPMPETTMLYERIVQARSAEISPLPQQNTPLVGRTDEIATLHTQLINPDCRLVSIVGFGGMGKTRLALAVGEQIAHENVLLFLDGVTFVPLTGVSSGQDTLARAIAQALDVSLPGRRSASAEISEYLEPEERLLILDNFEQLQASAGWLDHLLQRCPSIKLLVTSRVPLQLSAEWRTDLVGLPYPNAASTQPAHEYPAVQLLTQSLPSRTIIADACAMRLCQLVDGAPLAIKLAAHWLDTFSCERIVAELANNLDLLATQMADVPPRQRSMRAIFDQTWQLLSVSEQKALVGLSIFRGGFTEDAGLALSDCSLWTLKQLRDRGLVQLDAGRLSIHELVRQFSAEKRTNNAQIASEHAHFYAQLVANSAETLNGKHSRDMVRQLRPDLNNMRLAWQTLLKQKQIDTLIQMLAGWDKLLSANLLDVEAINLLTPALDLLKAPQVARERALVLRRLGFYNRVQFKLAEAIHWYTQLRDLARNLQDKQLEAEALFGLGNSEHMAGNYLLSEQHAQQTLALAYKLGDDKLLADILNLVGIIHDSGGRRELAVQAYRESMQIAKDKHDGHYLRTGSNLGFVLVSMGRYVEARSELEGLLTYGHKHGWKREQGFTLYHLGRCLWYLGEYDKALDYLEQSRAAHISAEWHARIDRAIARILAQKGQFDQARRLAQSALSVNMRHESAVGIGLDYTCLGVVESLASNFAQACQHLIQAIDIQGELGRVIIFEYAHLAYAQTKIGDLEGAKHSVNQGLELATATETKRETLWLVVAIGAVLAHLDEINEAQELLQMVVSAEIANADTKSLAHAVANDIGIELSAESAPLPNQLLQHVKQVWAQLATN